MRYGIVTDIHGDLGGLELALAALEARGCGQQVICLGDIVDEGMEGADACAELVRARCRAVLVGNHDAVAVRVRPRALAAATLDWLATLPERLLLGDTLLVHDNPLPEAQAGRGRWWSGAYIRTPDDARAVLEATAGQWRNLVVGHLHSPRVLTADRRVDVVGSRTFTLPPEERHVLCVGAVTRSDGTGAPPRAAIHDPDRGTFELLEVGRGG